MSYDLYLYPRHSKPPLQRDSFFAWFEGEVYQHENDTVNYFNEDTGVYFHFTWSAGSDDVEQPNSKAERWRMEPHVHFNMNYFRPHTFGLEAAEIVPGLVDHFDFVVCDPQGEGMGQGDFSVEGFLRGWNAGNRFAAQAFSQLRSRGELDVAGSLRLPAAVNRAYWWWNYNREEILEELQDDLIGVYVPPIWFCRENGQAKALSLFPNLVPTAVPKVDYVLVMRNQLPSPYQSRSKESPGFVRWEDLVAAASGFDVLSSGPDDLDLPHLILFDEDAGYVDQETAPKSLAECVISLPSWPSKPERISPDQILDTELLASC